MGKYVFDEASVKKDRNLSKIFRKNQLRGGLFAKGMFADLVGEGWDDPQELRKEYQPFGEKNQRLIDGVFLVTASREDDLAQKVNGLKEHFLKEPGYGDADTYRVSNDPVLEFPLIRQGQTRPDKGKEQ
jgi:hypothetical protein